MDDLLSGNGLLNAMYCFINDSRRNSIDLCSVHVLRQSIEPDLDINAFGIVDEVVAIPRVNLAHYVRISLLCLILFGANVEQRLHIDRNVLHHLLCCLLPFYLLM